MFLHLRMGVDLQPVEPLVALVLQIEEGVDHGEVEGLPEASGSCEEEDLGLVVDDIRDQFGLVYEIISPFADLPEIVHTAGNRQQPAFLLHTSTYESIG